MNRTRKTIIAAGLAVAMLATLAQPAQAQWGPPISPTSNPAAACLEFAQLELDAAGTIDTAGLMPYQITMGFHRLYVCVYGWGAIWLFSSVDDNGIVSRRLGLPPLCLPLASCN